MRILAICVPWTKIRHCPDCNSQLEIAEGDLRYDTKDLHTRVSSEVFSAACEYCGAPVYINALEIPFRVQRLTNGARLVPPNPRAVPPGQRPEAQPDAPPRL